MRCLAYLRRQFWRLGNQWWAMTLVWYLFAIVSIYILRDVEGKTVMTTYANFLGFPLVLPLAWREGRKPLKRYWRPLLLIAVMHGLDKNLTNLSMYHIGAALKTALHSFNVVITFFVAALLGADTQSEECLRGCLCRQKPCMTISLLMITVGAILTVVFSFAHGHLLEDSSGCLWQIASGVASAFKFTLIKLLFIRSATYGGSVEVKPNVSHIALIANPVTGVIALIIVLFQGKELWPPSPALDTSRQVLIVCALSVSVTGMLLVQTRLTQLTDALTVCIISVIKDVLVVIIFATFFRDEDLTAEQVYGFALSCLGAIVYACSAPSNGLGNDSSGSTDSLDSSCEQTFGMHPHTASGISMK